MTKDTSEGYNEEDEKSKSKEFNNNRAKVVLMSK